MGMRENDATASEFAFPVADDRARAARPSEKPSTRDALLAAAVDAFGQSGFEGVSVREVERRAGVNRGLVAHYFGTKDVLWEAAVDWLMAEFRYHHERHASFLALVSPQERARIIFKIYALFVAEHPEFFRLLLIEGREDSERTRLLAERYMKRLNDFFEEITDLGDDVTPQERAIRHLAILGALSVAFAVPGYSRVMFGVDPTDGDFPERMAELVGDLWLSGRASG
jgi:TetR/AcrR family transcriptional regulator